MGDLHMKAAWYERFGPPAETLQVGERPAPTPGHGEVLVQIEASAVNPHDTKKRSGWLGGAPPSGPIIPHSDGAGRIVAVGDGVEAKRVGEAVWIFRAGYGPRAGAGTAAAFCAVPDRFAVRLPDGVDASIGAGLGVPAMTAHVACFLDGSLTGRTVLVQGGAGAVASYAIQFAKWDGATVIATVSSPEKAAYVSRLGADHVVDYRSEDVAGRVMDLTGGEGVDRIVEVDFGANVAVDAAVLKTHGVVASYSSTRVREPVLPYYAFAMKGCRLHFVQGMLLTPAQQEEAARDIVAGLRQHRFLHPPIHRFALEDVAGAHAMVEAGGFIGKVVVTL